jgi:AraC-like DNA-binding protein
VLDFDALYSYPTIPGPFVLQMAEGVLDNPQLSLNLRERVEVDSQKEKVSINEYVKLTSLLQKELNDEMLGFFQQNVPLGAYSTLCQMLRHSPNIETAVINMARFFSLFTQKSEPPFELIIDGNLCIIKLTIQNSLQDQAPFYSHCILLSIYKTLCWLTSQRLPIHQAGFHIPEGPYINELAYLFGCEPIFSTDFNFISFDRSYLQASISPLEDAQKYANRHLPSLLIWAFEENIVRKSCTLIAKDLASGKASLKNLAEQMNMSRHTVSRRLKAANTSFQKLHDRVRCDRALYLLQQSPNSIQHIAEEVGFSEASAFSRAFKEWTGKAPSQFRD